MYRFEQEKIVRAELDEVWEFFSNPQNLQKMMPADMGFKVLDRIPESMYPGLLLRYEVSPLMGITLAWTSRIEFVEERRYFIDTQAEGPFRYWHHEHRFEAVDQGTMMKDILYYRLPLAPISKLFHHSIVRKRINNIFRVRNKLTETIFSA